MYAVVGCSDCQALHVVEGRPETTTCPQCGNRRQFAKLKRFVTTDDPDHAREVRAAMLAKRQGREDAFEQLDSFAEMDTYLDEAGVDDEEYLDASGVDPDAVAEAGDRAESGRAGSSTSRKETVLAALRELDEPTEADVVEYAEERGVPADYVRNALTKLVRRGEVSETRGTYRLL
jgi:DNA replicative helicase MCM subunit Mcm2 (Cdc46/Mcm family)